MRELGSVSSHSGPETAFYASNLHKASSTYVHYSSDNRENHAAHFVFSQLHKFIRILYSLSEQIIIWLFLRECKTTFITKSTEKFKRWNGITATSTTSRTVLGWNFALSSDWASFVSIQRLDDGNAFPWYTVQWEAVRKNCMIDWVERRSHTKKDGTRGSAKHVPAF